MYAIIRYVIIIYIYQPKMANKFVGDSHAQNMTLSKLRTQPDFIY